MNKVIMLGGVLCLLAVQTLRAEPTEFVVDPVHSSVDFTIRHLYTDFSGRFNAFSGKVVMDPKNLASLKVTGEVDILSIDTRNPDRNKHLLSPVFFDSQNFPKARFESTQVTMEADGKSAVVTGKLSIRDRTREVTMHLTFGGYGPGFKEEHRIGLIMTGTIARSDFGVSYNMTLPNGLKMLGEDVAMTWAIEAFDTVTPAPAAPAKAK